jgi:hypothetical protein
MAVRFIGADIIDLIGSPSLDAYSIAHPRIDFLFFFLDEYAENMTPG